jgi:hypothetical protein
MNIGEVTLTLDSPHAPKLLYASKGGEFQFVVDRARAVGSAFPVNTPPASIEVRVWIESATPYVPDSQTMGIKEQP